MLPLRDILSTVCELLPHPTLMVAKQTDILKLKCHALRSRGATVFLAGLSRGG